MTNNTSLNIKVIAGSTREGRFSDKATTCFARATSFVLKIGASLVQ